MPVSLAAPVMSLSSKGDVPLVPLTPFTLNRLKAVFVQVDTTRIAMIFVRDSP